MKTPKNAPLAALLTLALLLAGCSTHRAASARANTQIDATTVATLSGTSTTEATLQSWLAAMADSAAVRLSADSIVTPHGTIYGPAITVTMAAPRLATAEAAHTQRDDSITATVVAHHAQTTDTESLTTADATVIAEPPDGRTSAAWLIAIIVAVGVGLLLYICRTTAGHTDISEGIEVPPKPKLRIISTEAPPPPRKKSV